MLTSLHIKCGKVSVHTSIMLGVASSVASDVILRRLMLCPRKSWAGFRKISHVMKS